MYYINIIIKIININSYFFDFLKLGINQINRYLFVHFAHHLKNAKHINWKSKEIDMQKVSLKHSVNLNECISLIMSSEWQSYTVGHLTVLHASL